MKPSKVKFISEKLPKAWRLIYTINRENEVELVTAILDWFDHKSYERKFNY
jgi:hypothetical protein